MVWLPDGEKTLKIYLFVLTEFTNVTDRQTDGRKEGRTNGQVDKKLGCRRETARRFVSLNISLSHSTSLKVIRNDTLDQRVCQPLLVFHWTMYLVPFLRHSEILVENRDFFIPALQLTPPLTGSVSEYCHNVWYEKLKQVALLSQRGRAVLRVCQ